jgi:hypothetical protein
MPQYVWGQVSKHALDVFARHTGSEQNTTLLYMFWFLLTYRFSIACNNMYSRWLHCSLLVHNLTSICLINVVTRSLLIDHTTTSKLIVHSNQVYYCHTLAQFLSPTSTTYQPHIAVSNPRPSYVHACLMTLMQRLHVLAKSVNLKAHVLKLVQTFTLNSLLQDYFTSHI